MVAGPNHNHALSGFSRSAVTDTNDSRSARTDTESSVPEGGCDNGDAVLAQDIECAASGAGHDAGIVADPINPRVLLGAARSTLVH